MSDKKRKMMRKAVQGRRKQPYVKRGGVERPAKYVRGAKDEEEEAKAQDDTAEQYKKGTLSKVEMNAESKRRAKSGRKRREESGEESAVT